MAAACPPGLDGPRRGAVVLPRPGADGARARPLGGLAWPPAALVLPRRLAARPGAARRLRRAEGAAGPLGRGHGGVHRGQGGLRACRRGGGWVRVRRAGLGFLLVFLVVAAAGQVGLAPLREDVLDAVLEVLAGDAHHAAGAP